jgi:uncharacterized protein YndB with AHSA1/START domain
MSHDKTAGGRSIDMSIEIRSTLDDVWRALTTGEGLANWFPPIASAVPGPNGSLTMAWDPGQEWTSPIAVWQPNVRLGVANDMPSADGSMVRIAIDFHLEAKGGIVTVRLVQSGFDDSESWDGYIDGLKAGWTYFLENLRHYLERHAARTRVLISTRQKGRGSASERLTALGPAGLDVQPDASTVKAGQSCTLRLGDRAFDARVLMAYNLRAIAFVIPDLNDALLFVEREGMKDDYGFGIWLSVYGVDEERIGQLRQTVAALGEKLAVTAPAGQPAR